MTDTNFILAHNAYLEPPEEETYCPICDNDLDECEHTEIEIDSYISDWRASLLEDEKEVEIEQALNNPDNWGE